MGYIPLEHLTLGSGKNSSYLRISHKYRFHFLTLEGKGMSDIACVNLSYIICIVGIRNCLGYDIHEGSNDTCFIRNLH